jgi:putative aldouronate transport system permease protein
MKKKIKNYSLSDIPYMIVVYGVLWGALLVVLLPCIYIISSSFSSPSAVASGQVWLLPVNPTLLSYQAVFMTSTVWVGFRNSLMYAILGTVISVLLTLITAYPLANRDLVGKGFFMFLFTFTMMFSGGLIPTFLIVKDLGMVNTIWAMVIPGALSVWMMIIARTYIQQNIPLELQEAAMLDGCGDGRYFIAIVMPLSPPLIAVMALMYAVGQWNSFFSALIYLQNENLFPLQIYLRNILILNQFDMSKLSQLRVQDMIQRQFLSSVLKYALIVVASLPVMLIYPFVQKYFIKGIMIGALKG